MTTATRLKISDGADLIFKVVQYFVALGLICLGLYAAALNV